MCEVWIRLCLCDQSWACKNETMPLKKCRSFVPSSFAPNFRPSELWHCINLPIFWLAAPLPLKLVQIFAFLRSVHFTIVPRGAICCLSMMRYIRLFATSKRPFALRTISPYVRYFPKNKKPTRAITVYLYLRSTSSFYNILNKLGWLADGRKPPPLSKPLPSHCLMHIA